MFPPCHYRLLFLWMIWEGTLPLDGLYSHTKNPFFVQGKLLYTKPSLGSSMTQFCDSPPLGSPDPQLENVICSPVSSSLNTPSVPESLTNAHFFYYTRPVRGNSVLSVKKCFLCNYCQCYCYVLYLIYSQFFKFQL